MDAPADDLTTELPAALDTLAALRLPRLLRNGAAVTLSGRNVETAGLAGLQWLALAVGRGAAALVDVGEALAEAIRDAGLGAVLLGETPPPPGRTLHLRFTDAALDFGREPLAALAEIRAAGVGVTASLPDDPALLSTPDRLAIGFRLVLPEGLGQDDLVALLAAFADCATIGEAEAAPTPVMVAAAPVPDVARVMVAAEKLATLAGVAAELVIAQAALIDRLGDRRGLLAAEVAETERLGLALQDAVLAIGLAPLDTLLGPLAEGGALEIERAVAERIAGPLAALRSGHALAVAARTDGGFVRLTLSPTPPEAALAPLAAAARGAGGRVEHGQIVLPRSLSLLDAIIVEIGASSYALPVQHMVEALQPTREVMASVGPEGLLLRFREQYLPVVRMGARLGLTGWCADPLAAVLIVVQVEARQIALMVDTISDQRQIVAMPFAGGLAPPPGTTGAAIVRGNRIALILDVPALA